ncbi:GPW/gp25 family protein [Psychrobacter lutiphocae]|uniref:GPW/gp25 family protein n=1 Tax=Psychrobacter lutiphocae TaxID=540500 RepID=UPI0003662491|nr:GPW/gp25 family protein [Psychrobacter lutiphocae]
MTNKISNSLHWQSSLDNDGIVEGFADVEQAIRIILSTPKGNVPHRPEFGCDILPLIDGNFKDVAPLFIARATDAILTHEPRVQSLTITARQYGKQQGFAGSVFNIKWTPIDSLVPQNMTYRV